MDKYEFNIKVEQIKKLVNKKDFVTAMKIADTIDWRRVRNANLLSMISQVYEKNGEFQEAKEVLLLAFERAPIGKRLLYKLTELALKEGSLGEAEDYYREFCDLAPEDTRQHILRYMILKEKDAPIDQLIHSLERYTNVELDEKWMYELAELYAKAGRQSDCIQLCDKMILLFGIGAYVERAKELKQHYTPLAPISSYQRGTNQNFNAYQRNNSQSEESSVNFDAGWQNPESMYGNSTAYGNGNNYGPEPGYGAGTDYELQHSYAGEPDYGTNYATGYNYGPESGFMSGTNYGSESGYTGETSYSREESYANGNNYNPEPDYTGGNSYNPESGYRGGSGYNPETGYTGGNSYNSESGYTGNNGYNPESGYAGGNGYSSESEYAGGNGYNSESGYAGGNSYNLESGYTGGNSYNSESDYVSQNSYGPEPGYADESNYNQNPGYTGGTSYNREPNYADRNGYNPESGYEQERSYNSEPGYEAENRYNSEANYAIGNGYGYGAENTFGRQNGYRQNANYRSENENIYGTGQDGSGNYSGPYGQFDEEMMANLHQAAAEKELAAEMSKISIEDYEEPVPSQTRVFRGKNNIYFLKPRLEEEKPYYNRSYIPHHMIIEAKTAEEGFKMAVEALKKVHEETGITNQVIKITGSKLGRKGVINVSDKLAGKDLIIEEAGDLSSRDLEELQMLLERDETGMIVVLIDNPLQVEELHRQNPGFMNLFKCISSEKEVQQNLDTEAELCEEPADDHSYMQQSEPAIESEPEIELEPELEPEPEAESEPELESEPEFESEPEAESEPELESEPEPEAESKPVLETAAEFDPKSGKEIETEPVSATEKQQGLDPEPQLLPKTQGAEELLTDKTEQKMSDILPAENADTEEHPEEELYEPEDESYEIEDEFEEEYSDNDEEAEDYDVEEEQDEYEEEYEIPEDDDEELEMNAFADYAVQYANEIDCSITGKSMLALYERIEIMEEDGIPLTRANAEDLIEEAADKAEKPSLGGLIKGVFSSKYDKEGLLILKEEHFI